MALVTGAGSGIGRATAELFAARGRRGRGRRPRRGRAGDRRRDRGRRRQALAIADRRRRRRRGRGDGRRGARAASAASTCWSTTPASSTTTCPPPTPRRGLGPGDGGQPQRPCSSPARALIPQMLENGGGAIVNVASTAGLNGGNGGAAYTTSKHGVIGFTRQLCFDYAAPGIRANVICPGAVETGMTQGDLRRRRRRGDGGGAHRRRSAAGPSPTNSPASPSSSPATTPPSSTAPTYVVDGGFGQVSASFEIQRRHRREIMDKAAFAASYSQPIGTGSLYGPPPYLYRGVEDCFIVYEAERAGRRGAAAAGRSRSPTRSRPASPGPAGCRSRPSASTTRPTS